MEVRDYAEVCRPGVYLRRDPVRRHVPVLVEVPRSGAEYPREFRSPAPFDAVHRSISMYVEELWSGSVDAGATWLFATFPNAWIDLNRHELDLDPELIEGSWPGDLKPTEKSRLGIGLIHRVCGAGDVPLQGRRLRPTEVKERLEGWYWPYHHEVARLLADLRREFGIAYHLSCHSMASVGGPASADHGVRRSTFDLGDGRGVTCEPSLVETVRTSLIERGHEVTVNRHYAGAECIHKHGDPTNGVHSLQIEINRALYMDEQSFTRAPGFARLKDDLTAVAHAVGRHAMESSAAMQGARS
jgi:N-formylglutamate deformylase